METRGRWLSRTSASLAGTLAAAQPAPGRPLQSWCIWPRNLQGSSHHSCFGRFRTFRARMRLDNPTWLPAALPQIGSIVAREPGGGAEGYGTTGSGTSVDIVSARHSRKQFPLPYRNTPDAPLRHRGPRRVAATPSAVSTGRVNLRSRLAMRREGAT